ncbi:MAG: RNA-binding S4 domain-containing protein [Muribaculaceae bacterium]|nr:RNA-binding S4 domain-containing protein [Muribaculaceae bacterium]
MEERIDKWLWAMRVFKTRTIATDACKKGRVMMGGNAVKPSRTVKPGDVVEVRKPPITYTFRVKAVTGNRLGAKLVPEYLENITPQSQYDLLEMTRISGFVDRRKGLGRPTKRDSRELSRFREDTYADTFYLDSRMTMMTKTDMPACPA